ncbi:hypothetical protein VTN02DRAFT_1461 [Thermoascus thermophilus]
MYIHRGSMKIAGYIPIPCMRLACGETSTARGGRLLSSRCQDARVKILIGAVDLLCPDLLCSGLRLRPAAVHDALTRKRRDR